MRRALPTVLALIALVTLWSDASAPPARAVLSYPATPPMGWNPWYEFRCGVNESLVVNTAQALISSGLAAAGYRYVNLDDCWMAADRAPDGRLRADPARFPEGIPALARYLHSVGLKLGVYLDAGSATCLGLTGSAGNYSRDAATLAAWGVDFVKVDFCATGLPAPQPVYADVSRAFADVSRRIVLSVCDWGIGQPWRWAPSLSAMWRTTQDLTGLSTAGPWPAVLQAADLNAPLWPYARPGHFNDPDILLAGTGLLSAAQGRAQLSLWAMMAAPLLMDADVAHLSPADIAMLGNREVVAVDQDRAGRQGRRLTGGVHQIWERSLADGDRALLLLNTGAYATTFSLGAGRLGLPSGRPLSVRDLWAHTSQAESGGISADVPAGGVTMLRISTRPAR